MWSVLLNEEPFCWYLRWNIAAVEVINDGLNWSQIIFVFDNKLRSKSSKSKVLYISFFSFPYFAYLLSFFSQYFSPIFLCFFPNVFTQSLQNEKGEQNLCAVCQSFYYQLWLQIILIFLFFQCYKIWTLKISVGKYSVGFLVSFFFFFLFFQFR